MRNSFRLFAAIGILVLSVFPAAAQYPSKPIRVIVPFAPGGAADLVARIVAQPLSQTLGQSVIVENKPGADGAIAGTAVATSAPDGYTLLFGSNTGMIAVPLLRKNPPYDPVADFTPITSISRQSYLLAVNPSVPAATLSELVAYARANPGKLNYAAPNSLSVVASARLMSLGKIDMVEVPYKGDAPALLDLLSGRIHLVFIAAIGSALPHVKDGKLRALAINSKTPLLPGRADYG